MFDGSMKSRVMFIVEVALAFAVVYALQKKVYALPVIGEYLPGGQ